MKEKDLKIGELYKSSLGDHNNLYLYRGEIIKKSYFEFNTSYRFFNITTMKNIDLASTFMFKPL